MRLSAYKLLGLVLFCLPLTVFAEKWSANSGQKHMPVLEVFTAEGCGSCPPAVNWLTKQRQQQHALEYIVLGFHVDYLNEQKGWVDKFAKPAFSARQQQLAQLNMYRTIYTPEFVLSGESLPNWRENLNEAVSFLSEFDAQATIDLTAYRADDLLMIGSQNVVNGDDNRQHSKLYLAITEDDVNSDVKGGDNAGETFNHQDVVREWLGPFELDRSGETFIEHHVALSADWQQEKLKLVALIQNLSNGYVLQAVELPLTR